MAWRNQGITGSNNIPLGARRRFGGSDSAPPPDDGGYNPSQPSTGLADGSYKRGRSPERAYTLHLRIQEISEKLRINDVVPADGDRSPSPPPQYDNFGRRVNTREYRYRKRLEDERHKQIEKAMKIIPNYHPPSDYRRPTKTQEKVYVPVNDYPEINFIGLLIGPRGNTLKKMETESLAKIAIRGKGSVKEGKGRSDAAHTSNQEEDLHCLIMADTEEKVNKAKKLIHNVIETAASIPEGQNELKRNQLRELAALNGTLRDDENQACQNCGLIGHRKYDCPEQRNFTANIICRVCGNAGHMARDCPDRQRGADWRNGPQGAAPGGRPAAGRIGGGDANDREYELLMQELSGGAPGGAAPQRIEAGPGGYENGQGDNYGEGDRDLKPWQRGPTGAAAPWQQRGDDRREDYSRDGGAAPPWAGRGGGDSYGGYGQGAGYGGPPGGGAAPWLRQNDNAAPHPASGGQYGGYGAYPGGYGDSNGGYGGQQAMGAPPGLGGGAGGLGAPPGLGALFQNYTANGSAGGAPPPPPSDDLPPPPPSDQPPPPPPPGN
ncbi:splicing factor 1, partial [Lecanoromycetidae sp. Uapishka_2]